MKYWWDEIMNSDESKKILMPMIKNHLPTITAQDIMGVQSMNPGNGKKFWDSKEDPLVVHLSYQLITKEFKEWCKDNNLEIIWNDSESFLGKAIIFPSEQEKIAFILRWA